MMTRIRGGKRIREYANKKKVNNKWKLIMMIICGSLRIFWHLRPILSGAAGRRDVREIQEVLK